MLTEPVWVTVTGLNVALEFGGRPLAVNVTAPTLRVRLAVKLNVPTVPAVTVTGAFGVGVIVSGVMVVTSEELLFARLASLIPERLALLVMEGGTFAPTLTVSVIGG